MVVHYAGVGCEMDAILEIAGRHGLTVIEDNAHGLFGRYRGQILGTFGSLATQSFHETKNITCGEGGALLINDPQFTERAEILREKGTNRSRFFRGQVDKYTWVDVGSSYLPSDVLAAFLYAQLEQYDLIQEKRGAIWQRYQAGTGRLGKGECGPPALYTGTLRATLPYVLPAAAIIGGADSADRAAKSAGYPGRLPLPATAHLGHGPQIWRARQGIVRLPRKSATACYDFRFIMI